jgi:putative exosortase-associated protein (TIGR04073 family)
MVKSLAVFLIAAMVLSFSTATFAANKESDTKLERGAKNIAFGWTEIPKDILDTSHESNGVVGITVGTVKGICNAFARTVSGIVDVATFKTGTYEKPIIKPSMISDTKMK